MDVALNVVSGPSKITLSRAAAAVDIGRLTAGASPRVIFVRKGAGVVNWSSIDLLADAEEPFASVAGKAAPVLGCYMRDSYAASSFVKTKKASYVESVIQGSSRRVAIPRTARLPRCGPAANGQSVVYYMALNTTKKTYSFFGRGESGQILSTKRLAPRTKGPIFGVVPLGPGRRASLWVLSRQGKKQVLQILDGLNRWREIVVPPLPRGTKIKNVAAVSYLDETILVLQTVDKGGTTGFVTIPVTEMVSDEAL